MPITAPPLSPDQHFESFDDRRRTPPDVRAEREEELQQLTREIAERIRPAFSHLEEGELLAIAREMARTDFRYRDGGSRLGF